MNNKKEKRDRDRDRKNGRLNGTLGKKEGNDHFHISQQLEQDIGW